MGGKYNEKSQSKGGLLNNIFEIQTHLLLVLDFKYDSFAVNMSMSTFNMINFSDFKISETYFFTKKYLRIKKNSNT